MKENGEMEEQWQVGKYTKGTKEKGSRHGFSNSNINESPKTIPLNSLYTNEPLAQLVPRWL